MTHERAAGGDRSGAVVLAGGRARRMNGEKVLAPIGSSTVLARVIAACPHGPLVLVGPPELADAAAGVDLRVVREEPPFGGPLAGLRAGLAVLSAGVDPVVVLAGDLPLLTADGVGALLDLLASDPDADVAAYRDAGGQVQYLCAVWRRASLTTRLEQASASVRSLYAGAHVLELPDTQGVTRDVDTPDDLRLAIRALIGDDSADTRHHP